MVKLPAGPTSWHIEWHDPRRGDFLRNMQAKHPRSSGTPWDRLRNPGNLGFLNVRYRVSGSAYVDYHISPIGYNVLPKAIPW